VNETQIFTNALKLSTPIERAAYLDEVCAGNPKLRADVETLLRAHADEPGHRLASASEDRTVRTWDATPVEE
jgi:hypothetical protein